MADLGMSIAKEMFLFITVLLLWLGMAYGIHRLAHWRAPWNLLHRLHAAHHQPGYLRRARRLRWHHFLLCFGSVSETLDIWFTLTLPLLAISLVLPVQGAILLAFHYLYEIFCSDAQLDHNPRLSGPLTRVFAWGEYHLRHHSKPSHNFGLILTLWDRVFATAC
jgi:sterol desaturase/sphingolipid hydroxylase (fatty acid hydroxylase superfamily)